MLPRQESDHPLDKIRFGLMVAIGGEDPTETLKVIAEQQQIVERELVEIPRRAEALGEDFRHHAASVLESLLAKLSEYSKWLGSAGSALEASDTTKVMELHEQSQDLLPEITGALAAYNRIFAGFGPYQSSLCNTLWRLSTGLEKGQIDEGTWHQYRNYFVQELAQKLETVAAVDLPGRTALVENYSECLQPFERIVNEDLKTPDQLKDFLAGIDEQLVPAESLEQLMATSHDKGPTKIPATNVLLAAISGRDQLGESIVLAVLDDYNETVESFLETFEQAVARPTHSELIREEIPRTLDTIDSHFMLIEDLNDILEDEGGDGLAELAKKIEENANRLIESREVYEVAALHQSHKACPACGRSNPPENRYCEACGETLPQEDKTGRSASSTFSVMSGPISEENQQAEMTENVARLFQSCDDVNDGKITKDQYAGELQLAANSLTEFVEEYENQVNIALDESLFTPEEWENWRTNHLPQLEDMAISYYAGIEDMRAGLVSMETYLSDPNRDYLVEGIRLYWQGVQAIHRGKLAVETHTKLLDDLLKESNK